MIVNHLLLRNLVGKVLLLSEVEQEEVVPETEAKTSWCGIQKES